MPIALSLRSRPADSAWSTTFLAAVAAFSKPSGEPDPDWSVVLNVWSAMVVASLDIRLMIFFRGFESGRHRAFRHAAHALAHVLRGFSYSVGRQTLRFGLPGGLVIHFAGGVPGLVKTLRGGGLGTSLHRLAGVADEVILDLGAGQC